MLNRLLAAFSLFATTAGTGILMFEGLSLKQKVAAALLNALGIALAGVFQLPSQKKAAAGD
jgi:hypothetical protein